MCKLEENKKYTGENNVEYFIIQKSKDIALLKSKNEYVIANGIDINEKTNKIYWKNGNYFSNLLEAIINYEKKTCSLLEEINNLRNALKCLNHFTYFSAIVENELNYGKDTIDEHDLAKLDVMYKEYMNNDSLYLVSDELYDIESNLNYYNIKKHVINYLEQENVEIDKIDEQKLEEIISDVVDYSIEMECSTKTLIWEDEYLSKVVEELLDEENEL